MEVNKCQPLSMVLDGLSNTMIICEDAGRPKLYHSRGQVVTGTASGAGWADHDNYYHTHGANFDGTGATGPCAINCNNNNEIYSFHPGIVQCLFLDGAVRVLRENIPMRFVGAFLTRAAGETVSPQ